MGADAAGIELSHLESRALGVGGQALLDRTTTVALRVGDHAWEAPVSFCDPWPWGYQLLGQEGFFRWFEVCVRAADLELEVTPIES